MLQIFAVGAVLGQQIDMKPTAICYASKTLAGAQLYYKIIKKELLAVVDYMLIRHNNM